MRRVVVTGMGVHSPLGDSAEALFDAIVQDRTGVVAMDEWTRIDGLDSYLAAPVAGFTGRHIPRKSRRTMGRVALLAASAAERAVQDAGMSEAEVGGDRVAVVMGSTAGSSEAMQRFFADLRDEGRVRDVLATTFFQVMSHTAASNVALHLGLSGETWSSNSACASGSQAIGLGLDRIRSGRVDVALCGGAEELHLASPVVFQAVGAATTRWGRDADSASRPFDSQRDGIVVGEGAGVLVLEERDHALARGATILAEVLGHGTSSDSANMASARIEPLVAAMARCLADARLDAAHVAYLNAHATGTRHGDAVEAQAVLETLGDAVPVSSSKGHLGHTLGACGAIESVVCVEAMRRGIAPGTRNLTDPDVAPIRLLTASETQPLGVVMNTNFAFGGVNSALLFGHPSR